MNYAPPSSPSAQTLATEALRLEAVTACVGFDDFLDVTLALNHPHLDTMIVVTSHEDRATQKVAQKHGAICVQTDLLKKNGRGFNKGAAINAGLARFQYHGWRLHVDADIMLPDNFRRMLFNHTSLDPDCLYGADRIDVIGKPDLAALKSRLAFSPQAAHGFLIDPSRANAMGARYVDTLRGYCPMGFFQLWNARCQHTYPWSLGTAAHDDVLFADQWPGTHRRHLPTAICYHLCAAPPAMGENWDGHRSQPRFA
jgi:hypothetical protein